MGGCRKLCLKEVAFMPWTLFRLRAVSCKLGFVLWRLLVITTGFGEGICHRRQAQEPSCCRQSLKQLKAHFHISLQSFNSAPETCSASRVVCLPSPSPRLAPAPLAALSSSLLQVLCVLRVEPLCKGAAMVLRGQRCTSPGAGGECRAALQLLRGMAITSRS